MCSNRGASPTEGGARTVPPNACVESVRSVFGRACVEIRVFGSCAFYGTAPPSDVDIFVLLARAPKEGEDYGLTMRFAGSSPPLNAIVRSESESRRGVLEANVGYLEMVAEGRSKRLWGVSSLRDVANEVTARYRLAPRPEIGKGCWVAAVDLPAGPCRRLYERAAAEPANTDLEAARRADLMLQALAYLRVRGNLEVQRSTLKELVSQYVLNREERLRFLDTKDDPDLTVVAAEILDSRLRRWPSRSGGALPTRFVRSAAVERRRLGL